jgi:hypothetical protein
MIWNSVSSIGQQELSSPVNAVVPELQQWLLEAVHRER